MLKFFLSTFVAITLLYCDTLLAVKKPFPEDVEHSKRECIISGVPREQLEENTKGVLTLCFKRQEHSRYDHVALVFENYSARNPTELTLRMTHYGREDDCCGHGGQERVINDNDEITLWKVFRGQHVTDTAGLMVEKFPPTYRRYASWILPHERLEEAFATAEKYERMPNFRSRHTCVTYAIEIMRKAGLNVNFSKLWPNTPEHLKWLVDHSTTRSPHWLWGGRIAKPYYTKDTLPQNPHLEDE